MSTNKPDNGSISIATEQPTPQRKQKLPLAFTDGPATPLLPAEPTAMQTIAGVMGNVLEWYDFALFGFFSDVIAEVFFAPPESSYDAYNATEEGMDDLGFGGEIGFEAEKDTGNLIKSFLVYGAAFLSRPLGGLIIGYIGDKQGRKQALVLSLFLMAFPTFLMGCLPTYKQIGGWSTTLLMCCRVLQGMSVGGQLPASLIYTVESKPTNQWGFYGSLVMMASNVGTLCGNLVGALLRTILTDEQLYSWGWRIPFLSGILIAFVGIYLRVYGEDMNTHTEGVEDEKEDTHWREVFRKENLPALGSATFTPMLWGAGFYTTFVWMAIFMGVLADPPKEHGFWINAMSLLIGLIIPLPLAGMLSDYVGRFKVMCFGAFGLAIVGPIGMMTIATGSSKDAFCAQCAIGVFLALFGAPMNAWLVDMFPAKIRLTSAALGYDLANCSASAFSPLVATLLTQNRGPNAVGGIYTVFAVVAFCGMFLSTKIQREEEPSNCKFVSPTLELGDVKEKSNPIV